jgi:hypothetical protein
MIGTGIWEFNLGLMLIWCEILKPMFSSRFFLRLALLLLLAVTISYAQAPGTTTSGPLAVEPGVIHFEDVARQAELNFLNVSGGNGAVIFDYDNDGWPDIYLPNGSIVEGFAKDQEPTGRLYHSECSSPRRIDSHVPCRPLKPP